MPGFASGWRPSAGSRARLADRYDPITREDIPEHLREIVERHAAALV